MLGGKYPSPQRRICGVGLLPDGAHGEQPLGQRDSMRSQPPGVLAMTRSPLSPRRLPILLLIPLMVGTPLGTWAQDGSLPTGPFGAVLADETPVPGFIPGGEGACERFLNVGRLVLGGSGEYALEIGHSHYCASTGESGGFQWRSEGHVHGDEGDRLPFRPSDWSSPSSVDK